MKTCEEILLTIGANKVELLSENEHWNFWKGIYTTPAGSVSGFYLYLYSKCPGKEANSVNISLWKKISGESGYEIIVSPGCELIKNGEISKKTLKDFAGKEIYSTRSFLYKNLISSLEILNGLTETYYIEPTLILEDGKFIQEPSFFLANWLKGEKSNIQKSVNLLAIIAHGGVGKTTLVKEVNDRLKNDDGQFIIPLLVESEQWRGLLSNSFSLSSVWESSIARLFQNPARLKINEMAFRVLVREGNFAIIFDGFDELCISTVSQSPTEIIKELLLLTNSDDEEESNAKIIITSRKNFWESIEDKESISKNIEVFQLRGFDTDQKQRYFQKRLQDPVERTNAFILSRRVGGQIYEGIQNEETNFDRISGSPFILDLIARYVHENDDPNLNPYETDPLTAFLNDVCKRENVRQTLSISPEKQFEIFEELFREYPTTFDLDNLEIMLDIFCGIKDKKTIQRFSEHHFITKSSGYNYEPRYEVLKVYFIARFLFRSLKDLITPGYRKEVAKVLAMNSTGTTQVIEWLVLQLQKLDNIVLISAIKHAFEVLNDDENINYKKDALQAIGLILNNIVSKKLDKQDRTRKLGQLSQSYENGIVIFREKVFTDNYQKYDFSNVSFLNCRFNNIQFKNCIFNSNTIFSSCTFEGYIEFHNNTGQNEVIHVNNVYSKESEVVFSKIFNKTITEETKIFFAEDALTKSLKKFKKGNQLSSIQFTYRQTGMRPGNPYNEIIWEVLLKHHIIEKHSISNVTDGGLNVIGNKEIKIEILNYLQNGVPGIYLKKVIKDLINN
ncbi:MAG: NACHT domain-containing protein [Bacteroidetes bacterium]|nr:NACHT domain-containing protein [Bacteroidota bacterium]